MKKIAIITIAILFLLVAIAISQIWYPLDSKGIQWNAPTMTTGGNPIPADNILKYHVYSRNEVTGAEVCLTAEPILETQYYVTITEEGRYWLGVQALRYLDDGTLVAEPSEIAWSDDPAVVVNGQTWGILYYFSLEKVDGLEPIS